MPQLQTQQHVARQVERIVRQLTSLSTLPTVAAGLLNQINDRHADPAVLAENIQSDPALTARVLMLANQQGIRFADGPTITEAVAKLPLTLLRGSRSSALSRTKSTIHPTQRFAGKWRCIRWRWPALPNVSPNRCCLQHNGKRHTWPGCCMTSASVHWTRSCPRVLQK